MLTTTSHQWESAVQCGSIAAIAMQQTVDLHRRNHLLAGTLHQSVEGRVVGKLQSDDAVAATSRFGGSLC